MALLKKLYDSQDDIPDFARELFTEKNGKWHFTGVEGIKTDEDTGRLQTALDKERTEHKKTKEKLRPITFGGQSIVDMNEEQLRPVVEAFDGYDELKTRAESGGKPDPEHVNKLVEAAVRTKLTPVERELKQAQEKARTLEEQVTTYAQKERKRLIHDKVTEAAAEAKCKPLSMPDILLNAEVMFDVDESGNVITKDQVGVTPGIAPDIWLSEMQPKRDWWPESKGGGAQGSKGNGGIVNNPYTRESWNITAQGQYEKQHGAEKADQAARAAGLRDRNAIHPKAA